jgi:hypothetical protein
VVDYVGFFDAQRRAVFSGDKNTYDGQRGFGPNLKLSQLLDGHSNTILLTHKGQDLATYAPGTFQVATFWSMGLLSWRTPWTGSTQTTAEMMVGFHRVTTISPLKDHIDPTCDFNDANPSFNGAPCTNPAAAYGNGGLGGGIGCMPLESQFGHGISNQTLGCKLSNQIAGSPHASLPVLWADGSVRNLAYGLPQPIYEAMAFFRDGQPIDATWEIGNK